MNFAFVSTAPADHDVTLRFFTKETRERTPVPVPEAEFSGGGKTLTYFHAERVLCAGLGKAEKTDARAVREASGTAARWLQKNGRIRVTVELNGETKAAEFAQAVAEGLVLGAYRFDRFKRDTEKSEEAAPQPATLEAVAFVCTESELPRVRTAAERGRALGEAGNYARELANSPPNVFFPETLAEAAEKLAAESGGALTAEIFDEARLRVEGFGGLLAVGGGSARPPRLIVIKYHGGPAGEKPLALVGKAMTFDSGGLSIKPALGMEEMVWDKCGGCAVFGAMHGVAALKPKKNIVAVVASAENMTGPDAYRPGDVVTVYDGKHIEINNTDAEGRVILADALGYARTVLGAAAMIDLATLTGACIVALGDETAGLWSTDDALKTELLAASERAGEGLWPMPLNREHEKKIESEIALIKNSSGRPGGACTAAAFLKHFVGDTPWAHLDIAGPAAILKDRADLARGATGFGARTLVELVCS